MTDQEAAGWYTSENLTVRLVQALFRHGDRSPTRAYKNDIYNESHWPQGYGQLSKTGKRQELNLGQLFRNLYITKLNFLSPSYKRTELYVRSTSIDRALMSAYSVLAGLYPPSSGEWSTDIGWQPIPVHTVPEVEDYLLLSNAPCPVAEEISNQNVEDNPKIKQIMEEHKHFFDYVSNHSGEPNTWKGIVKVLDPIYCQSVSENTHVPDWVTDEIFQEMLVMRNLYTEFWFPDGTQFLRGGVLLKEMIDHMVNKTESSTSLPQKLFLYSAHDSTVISLLRAMGLFDNRQPSYTACVIVELLESKDSKFFVRVWYKNETDGIHVLKHEKCNHDICPLETFVNLYKPSLPVDIKQECGVVTGDSSSAVMSKGSKILDITLICGILILIIFLLVFMCGKRDKNRDSQNYMPVPTEMSDLS